MKFTIHIITCTARIRYVQFQCKKPRLPFNFFLMKKKKRIPPKKLKNGVEPSSHENCVNCVLLCVWCLSSKTSKGRFTLEFNIVVCVVLAGVGGVQVHRVRVRAELVLCSTGGHSMQLRPRPPRGAFCPPSTPPPSTPPPPLVHCHTYYYSLFHLA